MKSRDLWFPSCACVAVVKDRAILPDLRYRVRYAPAPPFRLRMVPSVVIEGMSGPGWSPGKWSIQACRKVPLSLAHGRGGVRDLLQSMLHLRMQPNQARPRQWCVEPFGEGAKGAGCETRKPLAWTHLQNASKSRFGCNRQDASEPASASGVWKRSAALACPGGGFRPRCFQVRALAMRPRAVRTR
jgi:hypothetical protein